jgi:pentatricopeptide repeat protein
MHGRAGGVEQTRERHTGDTGAGAARDGVRRSEQRRQRGRAWGGPSGGWRPGARRRSCGGKLLREMWEHGGRIEDAVKVFNEMLAAGEVKPTTVMYNALIGSRRGDGSGRCGPNAGGPRSSRRRRSAYGAASRKEKL